mmetsp:Transcript_2225/g.2516  ORF Transcript_2225/g.2516 Transcript_2225/m.2516 type:complete len:507 (-) Transcript_2225:114-1634(-)
MSPPAQVVGKSNGASTVSVAPEKVIAHATEGAQPKKSNNNTFQPILKGVLSHDENGVVTWKGSWGMCESDFTDDKRAHMLEPFLYQRVKILEKGSNKTVCAENQFEGNSTSSALKLAKDGCFSGHFYVKRHPSNSSPRGSKTVRSSEKNLILRFTKLVPTGEVPTSLVDCYKVSGSGKNRFGKFTLEGNFDAKTGRMDLIRNYLPRSSRPMNLSRVKRELKDLDVGFNHQDTIISTIESVGTESVRKGKRIRRISAKAKETIKSGNSVKMGISLKHNQQIEDMKQLLKVLMMKDAEKWFCSPVNAQKLGLKDYHEIIRTPMDLGTIKLKLNEGSYLNADAVKNDIELTFKNALLYNTKGQAVHSSAQSLLSFFTKEVDSISKGERNPRSVADKTGKRKHQEPINKEKSVGCEKEVLAPVSGNRQSDIGSSSNLSSIADEAAEETPQDDFFTAKAVTMSQASCNSLKSVNTLLVNIDPLFLDGGFEEDLEEESILHLKNELTSIGFL